MSSKWSDQRVMPDTVPWCVSRNSCSAADSAGERKSAPSSSE